MGICRGGFVMLGLRQWDSWLKILIDILGKMDLGRRVLFREIYLIWILF